MEGEKEGDGGGVGYIYNSTYNLCKVVCTTTTTTVQRERLLI